MIRILLIEDSKVGQQAFIHALNHSTLNCEVNACDCVKEAYHALEDPQKYDIIFTDLNMPDISGIEFCQEYSKKELLPIIMLTGQGSERLAVESMKAGAEEYLVKGSMNMYRETLPLIIPKVLQQFEDRMNRKRYEIESERFIEKLKMSNKIKSRFLAVVSHDFKNPITVIKGIVNLLRDDIEGPTTDSQKYFLNRADKQCQYMLGLIKNFLDISAIDSGKMKINCIIQDPLKPLSDSFDSVKSQAQEKGIVLKWMVPDKLPEVKFDVTHIQEVLINLLSNAVKFCACGDKIEIGARVSELNLEIWVKDTGPGILEEELHKLFEPFEQLSNKPTANEHSTGLGLSIAEEIMVLHGGTIEVKSTWEVGTNFLLTLPLESSQSEHRSHHHQEILPT